MTGLESLILQTNSVHAWSNKRIQSIPEELWDRIPSEGDANIFWLVGHLITAEHFHSVLCMLGQEHAVLERDKLVAYAKNYGMGSSAKTGTQVFGVESFKDDLSKVRAESVRVLGTLTDENLTEPLEETKFKNPIANNKFDAISWNIHHIMWHTAQMATLMRKMNVSLK